MMKHGGESSQFCTPLKHHSSFPRVLGRPQRGELMVIMARVESGQHFHIMQKGWTANFPSILLLQKKLATVLAGSNALIV